MKTNHNPQTPHLHSTWEKGKAKRITEKIGASCIGESRLADADARKGSNPLKAELKEVGK